MHFSHFNSCSTLFQLLSGRQSDHREWPTALVGDLHQDRYKLASGDRLRPARQPKLGLGWEAALDCDPAADVLAGRGFPPPGQRSSADILSHNAHTFRKPTRCHTSHPYLGNLNRSTAGPCFSKGIDQRSQITEFAYHFLPR
jgi:hypothetical protein